MRHYQQALTSILGSAAHTNTSVRLTWRKATWPKPKSISQHWSEFASFPATNMMI